MVAACSKSPPVTEQPQPEPQPEPEPEPEPQPNERPAIVAPADAATPDAPLPPAPRTDEVAGTGRCKADTDCELSSWQSGCCTQACDGYAISTVELARLTRRENCAAVRTKPCPPPAPCPPPTHRAFEAFCKAGTCTTRRMVLPP